MPKILSLILLFPILTFSQDKFRFQVDLSYQTMLDYGRKFENVSANYSNDFLQVYKTEVYNVKHHPLSLSNALNLSFSINWFVRDNWQIEQSFSLCIGKYSEQISYELIDIGNGDSVGNPNYLTTEVGLGYKNAVFSNNGFWGSVNDILFSHKVGNKLFLGIGVSHLYHNHQEWSFYSMRNRYIPWALDRGANRYTTNQIGLVAQIKQNWGRFSGFIKFHQSLITLKRDVNKGNIWLEDGYTIGVVSSNLDYRFPMFIRAGISVGFGRIKRK